jgi:hypothetical protein
MPNKILDKGKKTFIFKNRMVNEGADSQILGTMNNIYENSFAIFRVVHFDDRSIRCLGI